MVFAVSVTTKRTSTPSRFTLPFSTMPPMRNRRPFGASFAATCVGVKKNTRFSSNALSTSAVATPSTARPPRIAIRRLVLGFTVHQQDDFERQAREGDSIGAPHVPRVAAHVEEFAHEEGKPRSRMMPRTRSMVAATLYIQNASAITSIPLSMLAAIFGDSVTLTEAPWCSVFHHFTE